MALPGHVSTRAQCILPIWARGLRFMGTGPVMKPIELIKRLRAETNAPLSVAKSAVDLSDKTYASAMAIMREEMAKRADAVREKVKGRSTREGWIAAATAIGTPAVDSAEPYLARVQELLREARVLAMLELACETDFVANSPVFQELARRLALTVAFNVAKLGPAASADVSRVMSMVYISAQGSNAPRTVEEEIAGAIGLLGENIRVTRVASTTAAPAAASLHGGPTAPRESAISQGLLTLTNLGRLGVMARLSTAASPADALDSAMARVARESLIDAAETPEEFAALYERVREDETELPEGKAAEHVYWSRGEVE